MYARFELMIQTKSKKAGRSHRTPTELWESFCRNITDRNWWWMMPPSEMARFPHFYNAFYVYPVCHVIRPSQMILDKFLAGEPRLWNDIMEISRREGRTPIELLKICWR